MPKNSKVTQREHSNEHVTESVADLLAHEEPVDYKRSVLNVAGETWDKQKDAEEDLDSENRPAWNSKLQYILAQIGYSVGLGNVWRFPYLCQKNGGGAYLVPYLVLLIIIGLPLFFLELAVGQRIRRGSIGVWNYVCPRLGGIGFASCLVCLFVGLYYNVIIGWSIFYFFKSFQYPLPWNECPIINNGTTAIVEAECEKSSATTYFWYREALDISNSISESGGLNWKMTVCLLTAWSIVCLAMIKGIQSSGKVLYFSSLFPYVVLVCFLVRGLLLRGAIDGILHMFTPKLDKMLDPQVWREAATQVFFALGLGFGGVIAFSSYNKQDNNCHFDAVLVSFINFFTSVLATLVVFAVLGFKANIMNEKCVVENAEKILGYLNTKVLSHDLIPPHVNFSHLTAKDYSEMYKVIMTVKENHFKELSLDACLLEDELNKSVQGTGLAFIAFTEAMTHFPASPFWSVMFFLMLINLGLGSMIGTMAGISTPIIDTFKVRKEAFTVGCCIFAFLVGLIFVQRSGNYFVTMFDDYSATLPLTVVVILENIAVAWIYGTKKFMQELTEMLGFRPSRFYYYTWKYISPICMAVLMTASIIQLGVNPPGYSAWIKEEASEKFLYYPTWAMAILISLIILATLPLPVVFILRQFHLVSDGSNALSVTYKKGRMMKDISNLEDNDETRFILSKVPSETPSPMPTHRSYLGPGSSSPMEMNSTPNGRYGSGYHLASTPESEL
ncbi:sodium-dependent neutral amino acid transporter SLC6A17 [Alligator mississippiensis]|uniref:Transporter n=1 Tax=Alligator mississippiensis TaxID=8496 RepID=A0A151N8Q3_ALLMI|nr:sodium-dependent neutral amino acid transporter SLC6A17 [Alligator mississippiensis]XP_019348102.1 sodium-dependent neutral amino acid transporter SLC6A17 [Alligator mississippiensis]KYO33141.1 sodium-dependent neutral amino acid transporter B(0)AT2 isoform A [Alligator mississippiensis]